MYYLRSYPLSLLTAAAICYLSFFTPPQTDMDGIPNIDKIVHICMYGGLSTLLWIEYLFRHPSIRRGRATAGCIVLPVLMSGTIEILQATCTENRSGDWLDFAANCTGVALASLLAYYLWRPLSRKHFSKKGKA
ncbi:VanZ family protein [Bacteroides gallinaceum]|uniref:VanZ family protein n=2 Tax=Bacteroidaceae TaxID=815 RepID=A0ABT7VGT3_9BACE|nr:VanZ family protein [Bacteroides gallinaceum]MBU3854952.1 VanZ family protein [Candidatus Phocaeicola excrementipullorum]MBW9199750.1 hypothetical protein [Bacteroidales bacterium SW299]MDM8325519.1 VanZ family protein [Bacteroides gallinaceum]